MTYNERNRHDLEVSQVVEEFLASNPEPSREDWMTLIGANPGLAPDLLDIAMLWSGGPDLGEAPLEAPVDQAVFASKLSTAINLMYKTPSPLLKEIESKALVVKGPRIRKLANELGLGDHVELLNGIMAGRIRAPVKLLDSLAEWFNSTVFAISAFFSYSFHHACAPSFKAENGKPAITIEPISWSDAVVSLHLSPEEEKRLLALENSTSR